MTQRRVELFLLILVIFDKADDFFEKSNFWWFLEFNFLNF
jgi:hypothetical protein